MCGIFSPQRHRRPGSQCVTQARAGWGSSRLDSLFCGRAVAHVVVPLLLLHRPIPSSHTIPRLSIETNKTPIPHPPARLDERTSRALCIGRSCRATAISQTSQQRLQLAHHVACSITRAPWSWRTRESRNAITHFHATSLTQSSSTLAKTRSPPSTSL